MFLVLHICLSELLVSSCLMPFQCTTISSASLSNLSSPDISFLSVDEIVVRIFIYFVFPVQNCRLGTGMIFSGIPAQAAFQHVWSSVTPVSIPTGTWWFSYSAERFTKRTVHLSQLCIVFRSGYSYRPIFWTADQLTSSQQYLQFLRYVRVAWSYGLSSRGISLACLHCFTSKLKDKCMFFEVHEFHSTKIYPDKRFICILLPLYSRTGDACFWLR